MTPWAHLPNAAHIDRVIASAIANPDRWKQALYTTRVRWQDAARAYLDGTALDLLRDQRQVAVWYKARNAGWDAIQGAARNEAQNVGWGAARDVVWDGVWEAAQDAILALCAYDDCAYMLDSDPSELAVLAKLGDPRAVMLCPACKVFHSLKEIA